MPSTRPSLPGTSPSSAPALSRTPPPPPLAEATTTSAPYTSNKKTSPATLTGRRAAESASEPSEEPRSNHIHKSRLYPDPSKVKVEKKARPADTSSDDDRPPAKKAKVKAETRSDSHMMLTNSISKLSGICERIEDRRRKHMKELERMRVGFCKEMEAQRKQLLEQAQAKIESL